MNSLSGKTIFITGASLGIGRAIALTCAAEGANIVIAAKTAEPHAKLPGTIHTVAAEVNEAGGKALPLQLDVRDESEIRRAMDSAAEHFGGIDAVINNAGAIRLTSVEQTPARIWDLMHQVNVRATNFVSRAAIPFLRRSPLAQIISMSPPLKLDAKWLKPHTPYTLSKYGMSLLTLGLSAELAADGIRVNSLWPRMIIATAAIEFAVGDAAMMRRARSPQIMADAVKLLLKSDDAELTGLLLTDEEVLRRHGITDFTSYAHDPTFQGELQKDLFVE